MKETHLIFNCPHCLLECAVEKSAKGQNIMCPSCGQEFIADQPIGETQPPEYEIPVETEKELDAMVLNAMEEAQKENERLNISSRIKGSKFKEEWDKLLGRDLSNDEIRVLLEAHHNWKSGLFQEMLSGGFEQLQKQSPQTVDFWQMLVREALRRYGMEDKAMLVKENMLRLNDAYMELVTGKNTDQIPESATVGGRHGGKTMKMVIKRGGLVELSEVSQRELDKMHRTNEMMNEICQKEEEMTKGGKMVMIKDLIRERLRIEAKYKDEESRWQAGQQG